MSTTIPLVFLRIQDGIEMTWSMLLEMNEDIQHFQALSLEALIRLI
jgi:hypothetical protein